MKNLFRVNYLPVVALVFAGGLAFATTRTVNAPNVYKNAQGQWQNLGSLQPSDYTCPGSGECTAHRDADGNISDINPGNFTLVE